MFGLFENDDDNPWSPSNWGKTVANAAVDAGKGAYNFLTSSPSGPTGGFQPTNNIGVTTAAPTAPPRETTVGETEDRKFYGRVPMDQSAQTSGFTGVRPETSTTRPASGMTSMFTQAMGKEQAPRPTPSQGTTLNYTQGKGMGYSGNIPESVIKQDIGINGLLNAFRNRMG